MQANLLSGLSEEAKETLKQQGRECHLLLRQVRKVLNQKLDVCEAKRKSRKAYFMPAWKEYQADCNGYLRAIEEVLQLMESVNSNLSDQEENP